MRALRCRLGYAAALTILSGAAAADAAPQPESTAKPAPPQPQLIVELPRVEVRPAPKAPDPLADADARLKQLQQHLPDPAGGVQPKDSLGQRMRETIENYVHTPHDINQLMPETQHNLERVADPLGHHERDAAMRPEPEDYRDAYSDGIQPRP